MPLGSKVFSGNTLRVGYRFQRYWDNSMAYAFFCAELGAAFNGRVKSVNQIDQAWNVFEAAR